MILPEQFPGRIYRTRFSALTSTFKDFDQIRDFAEGTEIGAIYENGHIKVVIVFKTQEDCVAFKLKYGDKYA